MVNNLLIINIVGISRKARHILTARFTLCDNPLNDFIVLFTKEAFTVHYNIHGYSL